MPFDLSEGPKSAGRARKKVELSSVKLIIAEGGNKVDGVWKEKNEPIPVEGSSSSVARPPLG